MQSIPTGKPLTESYVKALIEDFMKRKGITAEKFAADITDASKAMYGRPGIGVGRDSINRVLGKRERTNPDKAIRDSAPNPQTLQRIYNYLAFEGEVEDPLLAWGARSRDPFFRAICEQYGVDREMIDSARWEYAGAFSLHVYSEDLQDSDPPHVVRGAISFFYCREIRALMIKEMQRDGNDIEVWSGYFFESNSMCVIIARRRTLHIPKFYVLRPARYAQRAGNREVTSLEGRMLKVGHGGPPLSSRVYLKRDDGAYGRCGMFTANQLLPIMPHLGPPPRK